MTFIGKFAVPDPPRAAIWRAHRLDEAIAVAALLTEADVGVVARERIAATAAALVERVRASGAGHGGLDAFMREYDLANQEGVVLMCLAEALLRVPDAETQDRLIADKLGGADWQRHLGHSGSLFVNASTWALMLTGRVVRLDAATVADAWGSLKRLAARSGEPVIRTAMRQAMRIIGRQFVMGRSIGEALQRAAADEARGITHSFDMLGESAHTAADAQRYFEAYRQAIAAVGYAAAGRGPRRGPGVSVKLSALHPRFEAGQGRRVIDEVAARVRALAALASETDIGFTIDTEEADRLEPTLDVLEDVAADPALAGWEGLGIAVQAYQKRAGAMIDWLAGLARRRGAPLAVRLVKGAYWDAEIKRAQEQGLDGYPVFTRKANTDLSYIACAWRLFAAGDVFYPQFATHNAHTLAAVLDMAGAGRDYELQRLHGMGEALYTAALEGPARGIRCRIYAPVGSHEDLLAYLVRRLLENGSNSSFVNRMVDGQAPVADVVADPLPRVAALRSKSHPRIPPPPALFAPERRNSRGLDLADRSVLSALATDMAATQRAWRAAPMLAGHKADAPGRPILDPADRRREVGRVAGEDADLVGAAVGVARAAQVGWDAVPVVERASCLVRAADAMEAALPELMALLVREAGKTIPDALAEVREAVDFCRYYAARAVADLSEPQLLPGPTGESNRLVRRGRGVFVCISPWNFPLAIFTGQVTAALVAGNAVVAKPAKQTPLIAARTVEILRAAGVPEAVLSLLPGDGRIGAALAGDPRVTGVAFTGSVETAQSINRALAARAGPIATLIAETGGINVMIVDSTALPEQVVSDAVTSAFRSAGQRCSALRVLFVQKELVARITDMLAGAIAELVVGDPALLATDIGPVIDADALSALQAHAARMDREGQRIGIAPLPPAATAHGTFFAPRAYRIDRFERVDREVFGPILHVVAYDADRLDDVLAAVNNSGYGLTLGIHSRIDGFADTISARLRVGNTYVNRNMIGAVVGVQPFGGEGLSGTGPKAGGPHYLARFVTERTLTINVAATGGNAQLLSLDDAAD